MDFLDDVLWVATKIALIAVYAVGIAVCSLAIGGCIYLLKLMFPGL